MKRAIIIGAGLGGLATAARLAHSGFEVEVLEKNSRVGGKMDFLRRGGYTFDTGPSLLTMPFVLEELFESVGQSIKEYLDVHPVDPICRYFYPDGSVLDASRESATMEEAVAAFCADDAEGYRRFMAHAQKIYEASSGPFLFQPFGSLDLKGIARNIRNLPAMTKVDAFRTLNDSVSSFFGDPRLQQLFNRFATYNGSSPYAAPATLAVIPYIEFTFGGWYVRGGMYGIAGALESLARKQGAKIRTECAVRRIETSGRKVLGVTLASGETVAGDLVISNADALYTHEHLMERSGRKFRGVEPSLSGFVLLLGVRTTFPQLAHHNIFFSSDYRSEFDTMFREGKPAPDPTIYVSQTSVTDKRHAPEGCSNLFVLVNAPPLCQDGVFDWEEEKAGYREIVLDRLAARGLEHVRENIEVEEIITPGDFERKYNAFRGSIYGTSSNGRMAAFLRPPNKSRKFENLYFVGGSSHPGGGIPLVLLSGKIVSELIQSAAA